MSLEIADIGASTLSLQLAKTDEADLESLLLKGKQFAHVGGWLSTFLMKIFSINETFFRNRGDSFPRRLSENKRGFMVDYRFGGVHGSFPMVLWQRRKPNRIV